MAAARQDCDAPQRDSSTSLSDPIHSALRRRPDSRRHYEAAGAGDGDRRTAGRRRARAIRAGPLCARPPRITISPRSTRRPSARSSRLDRRDYVAALHRSRNRPRYPAPCRQGVYRHFLARDGRAGAHRLRIGLEDSYKLSGQSQRPSDLLPVYRGRNVDLGGSGHCQNPDRSRSDAARPGPDHPRRRDYRRHRGLADALDRRRPGRARNH